MPGEPILVVDDNAINLRLASLLLAREGYDVREASDAGEALAVLEEFAPQLILMDIQLPGMDGLELANLIKQRPATRGAVILAMTAYAMKGDEERMLVAGCDGYVAKPINTRTLPEVVAGYLNGERQARSLPPA